MSPPFFSDMPWTDQSGLLIDRSLDPGEPVLLEVGNKFLKTEKLCKELATYLLKNYPSGGVAYIESQRSDNAPTDWEMMTHRVLRKWCEMNPEDATTVQLYRTCRRLSACRLTSDALRFLEKEFRRPGDSQVRV